jgi:hypothetical protein
MMDREVAPPGMRHASGGHWMRIVGFASSEVLQASIRLQPKNRFILFFERYLSC